MLISGYGTNGDADDRDVIKGNFGCPIFLSTEIIRITSSNIPGSGTESQFKLTAEGDHKMSTKTSPQKNVFGRYVMLGNSHHACACKLKHW